MTKVTLTTPASFVSDASAVAQQGLNNQAITAAIENTLSRDGTAPNTMGADFDMNSHRILNLPAPLSGLEPVRVMDLNGATTLPGALAKDNNLSDLPSVSQAKINLGLENVANVDTTNATNITSGTLDPTLLPSFVSSIAGGTGSFTVSNGLTNSGNDIRLASIANNRMLANISGATAIPVAVTPGGLWDSAFSSSIGNAWIRLSGGWGSTALGYANPVWWGADATGVADSAAAFTSAIATGLPVCFPSGTFKIASQITVNLATYTDAFRLSGAGLGMTTLNWPNASGGIVVNATTTGSGVSHNVVDIRGLKLTTSQAAGSGEAIRLNDGGSVNTPGSILIDLVIQGDDYNQFSGSHYWDAGIRIHAWEAIVIERVQTNGFWVDPLTTAAGNGVIIEGDSASGRYTQSIKIVNCNFGYHGVGLLLLSYWQGVLINQTNFGGNYGIWLIGGQTGILVQLNVSNSIFYTANVGIQCDTNVIQSQVSFNNIIQTEATGAGGIHFGPSSQPVILGNCIVKFGTRTGTGIVVNADNGIVLGNVITGFTTGVFLGASSTTTICALNRYISTTNGCANAGAGNSVGTITS